MFMKSGWAVLVAASLVGADEPKNDAAAKDIKALQGTWILVAVENNGEAALPESLQGRKLIVNGDKTVFMQGDEVFSRSTQKLDAAKNPKQVDITQTEGPEKGKVTKGIYSIKGDELTVCYMYPGDGRPTEFSSKKDSGSIVLKFRREKK